MSSFECFDCESMFCISADLNDNHEACVRKRRYNSEHFKITLKVKAFVFNVMNRD